MDFTSEYPKLEAAQKERFQRVVSRLLAGQVLIPGSALTPDRDWSFAERYCELIDGYLQIGGWRLDLDPVQRLCRAVHQAGEQRVRLSKQESLVLCMLRLIYHEQMQRASENMRCEVTTGELRERLIQAGKAPTQVSKRGLLENLKRLARHSLADLERGFAGEDAETFVVTPLIEKVLSADRIVELEQRVRTYAGHAADVQETDEGAGDVTEGPHAAEATAHRGQARRRDRAWAAGVVLVDGDESGPRRAVDGVGACDASRDAHGGSVHEVRAPRVVGVDHEGRADGLLAEKRGDDVPLHPLHDGRAEACDHGRVDARGHDAVRVARGDKRIVRGELGEGRLMHGDAGEVEEARAERIAGRGVGVHQPEIAHDRHGRRSTTHLGLQGRPGPLTRSTRLRMKKPIRPPRLCPRQAH